MTLVSRPPNITYVELGKTLTLNVTYQTNSRVIVTWSKGSKSLISSDLGSLDPRASIKGQGTLVLINTTSSDNGIYKHQARTFKSTKDIRLVVVIQGKYSKYMSYLPAWRSVVENYFPEVSKTTQGRKPRGNIYLCGPTKNGK